MSGRRRGARLPPALATLVLAMLALAGCGAKREALVTPARVPFTVMSDAPPNADEAPFYAALSHGDLAAAGIDLRLLSPRAPEEGLSLLAAGRLDMAIAHEPELLLARDHGEALVSITALVPRPLAAVIALPGAHLTSAAQLVGARVGTAGTAWERRLLAAIVAHAGGRPAAVHEVPLGFGRLSALLHHSVRAIFGAAWNYEAVELEMRHRAPTVLPVERAGVPPYDELVLVVRKREAESDGETLRAMLHALARGAREVRADPRAAAAAVVQANPGLEEKLQLASIERTLALEPVPGGGRPFGYQGTAAWERFASWMYEQRMLRTDPATLPPPFTNEFLPGQGL